MGGMRDSHALPKWRSHKVVEGFQIKRIEHDTPSFVGGAILHGYDVSTNTKL